MILDMNISWGCWPFQQFRFSTAAAMKEFLRQNGIGGGLVRAAEAAFAPDLELCNRKLTEEFSGDDGFIPVPALNPYYSEWKRLDASGTFPAAVVYPGYHDYSVLSGEFASLAAMLAGKNMTLVIAVRQEDERGQHKFCKIAPVPVREINALGRNFPDLNIICLNCYFGELEPLLLNAPNINADLAFAETTHTIRTIAAQLGYRQLVFGSHTPFLYTRAALMKLEDSRNDEKTAQAVAAENAKRILKWKQR